MMSQVEQSRDEIRSIKTGLENTNKTLGQQDTRISQVLEEARAWQKEQEEISKKWREERELAWRKMQEEQEMWMRDQMSNSASSSAGGQRSKEVTQSSVDEPVAIQRHMESPTPTRERRRESD